MYNQLAGLPVPISAEFVGTNVIQVTSSTADLVRNVKRQTSKSIFLGEASVAISPSQDVGNVVASTRSPSGNRTAILRETYDLSGGANSKKRWVEIWVNDTLEVSQEVTATHGSFYVDAHLSSLSFSPSEHSIVYTAEANAPENTPNSPYEHFRFTPKLGESFPGKKRPTIYLFRWSDNDGIATVLPNEPRHTLNALSISTAHPTGVLLGQATFAADDRVLATGFEYSPDGRLLGLVWCTNRPSAIWELTIPTFATSEGGIMPCSASKLSSPGRSSRSPRVLSDGSLSTLFWLSNETLETCGAHASCTSLHSMDLNSREEKTLVDTVWEPLEDGFPGLYLDPSLPLRPFIQLGSIPHIITHSIWRSRCTVLVISTEDGKVKDLTPDEDGQLYSWKVFGTDGVNRVICSRSAPTIPHELVLGEFDESGNASWQILDEPSLSPDVQDALSSLRSSIVQISDKSPVETILLQPAVKDASGEIPPCVTYPHGGPHGTSITSFSPSITALALEGYTVSLPNYTGSLGFGETFVRELLGKCGTLDVQDCIASARHLVKLGISEEGQGKQLIQGGSHGGFLTAHLIGQYPSFFSAAVLRNPVISVGEISTSDIPDWYYGEFGIPYDATTITTPEIYEKLWRASPIAHVDAVTAPVLLMLGEVDQRVALTQGLNYYHALKARGKTVDVLCFPEDAHPLDGVEAAKVNWDAAREWFARAVS